MKLCISHSMIVAGLLAIDPAYAYSRSRSRNGPVSPLVGDMTRKKIILPTEVTPVVEPALPVEKDLIPETAAESVPEAKDLIPETAPEVITKAEIPLACVTFTGDQLINCELLAKKTAELPPHTGFYRLVNYGTPRGEKTDQYWILSDQYGEEKDGSNRRRRRQLKSKRRKLLERITYHSPHQLEQHAMMNIVFGECVCQADFERPLAAKCPNTKQCVKDVQMYNSY